MSVFRTMIMKFLLPEEPEKKPDEPSAKVLRTRAKPDKKKLDHQVLVKRVMKRYPKTMARLAMNLSGLIPTKS